MLEKLGLNNLSLYREALGDLELEVVLDEIEFERELGVVTTGIVSCDISA